MAGTEYRDDRPAFAGTGGRIPAAFQDLPTPCYILDEKALRRNGEILGKLAQETGCRILLAQKAFSNYDLYPVLQPYLAGTEASGLYEARLGAEEMPDREVHVFCAAYRAEDMEELLKYADHIVFNSPSQLAAFGPMAKAAGKSVGLRISPEHSTQEGHAIYDPCAPGSRMGTTREQWDLALEKDPALAELLDASAACHMPDVIEMPYLPPVLGAEATDCADSRTWRLAGPTCLAGDVIGDYRFPGEIIAGERLLFGDMAIYTTCKNNTFNGMPLPAIWVYREDGTCEELVHFGYEDFKARLGRI